MWKSNILFPYNMPSDQVCGPVRKETMDSFQVLKTKPPIYFLTIDKKTVELTGKQLNQQQLLSEQLFDQADIVWQKVKDKDY